MKGSAIKNVLIVFTVLILCFGVSLVIQYVFADNALSSAIFVLGVFLISVKTTSYAYGIISALLSVLAVNFAFTFPFFAFDFTLSENIVSAAILLVVTMITCGLATKVKKQEMIKAESRGRGIILLMSSVSATVCASAMIEKTYSIFKKCIYSM